MNKVEYVQCIETLTINENVEIYRVTTKSGERIIGLPMYTSQKSGDVIKNLTITMLYVPYAQTVMNIVDIETSDTSMCTIEPSSKHLIQPEMQFFWNEYKDKIVESFNRHRHDGI